MIEANRAGIIIDMQHHRFLSVRLPGAQRAGNKRSPIF
jgi:hypothetical protein